MTDKAAWQQRWERIALYLTFGSAVAVFFSIAACHILLALSVVVLLVSGARLRMPPVKLPLAIYFVLTVVSLLLSTDPAAGRPQIRKFFVFLVLLTVSSTFVKLNAVRSVVMAWFGGAALSAAWSLVQFWGKVGQARQAGMNFYDYYVSVRITGFMSQLDDFQWGDDGGAVAAGGVPVLLSESAALLVGLDCVRGADCGSAGARVHQEHVDRHTAVSALYLIWFWKRWLVLAVPVLLACGLLVSPASVRTRAMSNVPPQQEHRFQPAPHRMLAHRMGDDQGPPVFGVGPEHVGLELERYLPPIYIRRCREAGTATCTTFTSITRPSAACPPCWPSCGYWARCCWISCAACASCRPVRATRALCSTEASR
jgi:hypothetical protein